ncbi:c-type cytochrome [Pseudomonas sp. nanlin1]
MKNVVTSWWVGLVMVMACQAQAADLEAGEKLFTRVCGGCHKVGPSARAAFGPELNGIFGRRAGSTEGYVYSPEMKASGIVWDREKLTAFVADPSEVVPGTKMRLWGISDAEKVDNLLAYLATFK